MEETSFAKEDHYDNNEYGEYFSEDVEDPYQYSEPTPGFEDTTYNPDEDGYYEDYVDNDEYYQENWDEDL